MPSISILTSDDADDDKDNGKGSDNGGSNYNNHRNSMDMGSNRSTGMGHNIVRDKVAPLTVHNTIFPPENDRTGGYQLLYLD